MAGTAPTDSQFTRMRDARPVHCSALVILHPDRRYLLNYFEAARGTAASWTAYEEVVGSDRSCRSLE